MEYDGLCPSVLSLAVVLTAGTLVPAHSFAQAADPRLQSNLTIPISGPNARVTALATTSFKLISPNTGWAIAGDKLLWTTNNGTNWKDISPSVPHAYTHGERTFSGVFFLDEKTGWVVSAKESEESNPGNDPNWRDIGADAFVSSTVDGGRTWTTSQVPRPNPVREMTGGGSIAFADKLHGWMDEGVVSNTAVDAGILYATSDGGRTWHHAAGDPGFAVKLAAEGERDLWLTGGPDYKLFVSHDGGATVHEVTLQAPPEALRDSFPTYGLPEFTNEHTGYEAVIYSSGSGDKTTAALFVSEDDGRSWHVNRLLDNLAESSPGQTIASQVAGGTWMFSFGSKSGQPSLFKMKAGAGSADGAGMKLNYYPCALSFLTPDEGWRACQGILESTQDGGATWTENSPHVKSGALTPETLSAPRPPGKPLVVRQIRGVATTPARTSSLSTASTGVAQNLAFDRSHVPTAGDMAAWWSASPYYAVGFYILNSPNRSNDPGLVGTKGENWFSAVASQGWGLIPIWFGLQAPCRNQTAISSLFHLDTQTAQQDGMAQADQAYNQLTNMGLDGSVIYFDIEPYSPSTMAGCSAAVTAYVGAFVQEAHEDGATTVGVYGAVDAAPVDLHSASPSPDAVWIASNAGHRITVWNLGMGRLDQTLNAQLTDSLWPSHGRMHQYRIDNNSEPVNETWGGVEYQRVDDDIIDSTIYPPTGTKLYTFQAPIAFGPSDAELGGMANGINDGTGTYFGPVAGLDPSAMQLFVDTWYNTGGTPTSQFYWPYSVGTDYLPNPPDSVTGDFFAVAVNNLGEVVGSYDSVTDSIQYGFIYDPKKGTFKKLDVTDPNLLEVSPNSINDAGWIIGTYLDSLPSGPPYYQQRCVLWKPPYKTPIIFDSFGGAGDCNQWYGFGDPSISPVVNGTGQIAGSAISGGQVDQWIGLSTAPVFLDDVQSNSPGPGDSVTIVATPPTDSIFSTYGLNNNGQISGTYLPSDSFADSEGFFINTDGVLITLGIPGDSCSDISGLNDDVQLVFPVCNGSGGGYFVDSQH